jgi:hypothetical protein
MKRSLVSVATLAAALACSSSKCSGAQLQQWENLITSASWCAVDVIGDINSTPDIAGTITNCSTTVDEIIAIIQSHLAALPDAGTSSADGAVTVSPVSARRAHLQAWLVAAQSYQAGHK